MGDRDRDTDRRTFIYLKKKDDVHSRTVYNSQDTEAT